MQMEMTRKWDRNTHMRQNRLKQTLLEKTKKGHYIMINGSIQEGDITFMNICTPNTGTPKYIQQILIDTKGQTENNTLIRGDSTLGFHQ